MSLSTLASETDSLDVTTATKPRLPRWRRRLRIVGIALASLSAVALASTLANAGLNAAEKSNLVPYGQTVTIPAGDLNVYRSGGSGATIVLLSGYGTPAPAIDFAPLIRELDAFDVIVVEGFGYGYSDLDVKDRSIENITAELHAVLSKLDIPSPVILAGHSVGGIYARYYANAYPDEVSAIIGIDPMAAMTSSLDVGQPSVSDRAIAAVGLVRAASAIVPSLVQPPGTAYTVEERNRIAAMTNWNYGNVSVSDEWAQIGANSTKANEHPFAADLPILEFLASENVDWMPDWLANHEAELAGVTTHQLEVLEGSHYLHRSQSPQMARTITEFVSEHVAD
jgi:pimeloyl-ACP methyl ester carboxylesterase